MQCQTTTKQIKQQCHDEAMAELFREDRQFAMQHLDRILREGDAQDLLVALRQMAINENTNARPSGR